MEKKFEKSATFILNSIITYFSNWKRPWSSNAFEQYTVISMEHC